MTQKFSGPAANPMPARMPKEPILIPREVAERAATRYVEDANGCWISTYSVASHGYAQIGWQTEVRQANGRRKVTMTLCHRAAWVYYHGTQIPDGMTVDHMCHNRRCVNPDHLRLLSNFENARRTSGRDWPVGECINGHPNRYLRLYAGKWACSICHDEWHAKAERERNAA